MEEERNGEEKVGAVAVVRQQRVERITTDDDATDVDEDDADAMAVGEQVGPTNANKHGGATNEKDNDGKTCNTEKDPHPNAKNGSLPGGTTTTALDEVMVDARTGGEDAVEQDADGIRLTAESPSASEAPPSIRHVSITNDMFYGAIANYVDENRPDPIVRRQMERWKFEWVPDTSLQKPTHLFDAQQRQEQGEELDGANEGHKQHQQQQQQQHPLYQISGYLIWKGDYVQIRFQCICQWRNGDGDDDTDAGSSTSHRNTRQKDGSLHFSCFVVSASERPFEGDDDHHNQDDGNTTTASRQRMKGQENVHKRMVQRLLRDDYVRKLVAAGAAAAADDRKSPRASAERRNDDPTSASRQNSTSSGAVVGGGGSPPTAVPLLLCRADVLVRTPPSTRGGANRASNADSTGNNPSSGVLEERYYTDEVVAEAIRRAVWSSSSSSSHANSSGGDEDAGGVGGAPSEALDVFDVLVRLPILPCTGFANTTSRVHTGTNLRDSATAAPAPAAIQRTTTPLADRAQLRLLEDAMYDACEKEELEENVQEMNLSSPEPQQRQQQHQHRHKQHHHHHEPTGNSKKRRKGR